MEENEREGGHREEKELGQKEKEGRERRGS